MISLCAAVSLLLVFVLFSCEKAILPDEDESEATNGNLRVSVYQIEKTSFSSLFPGASQSTTRSGNEAMTRAGKAASEVVIRLNFAYMTKAVLA